MDRVKQRLKLLHNDITKLEKEIIEGRSKTSVTEWREILKIAREIEEFAVRQITIHDLEASGRLTKE